ncbi:MAG: heavy metal-responsive transcriptional regulator [Thermodesulfobacteriota bacterium]
MADFTIGMLAKLSGVNIETVRFYERKAILPKPKRKPSGYRLYTNEDLKRLKFILMAKTHGFTLNEIKDLLNLRVDPESTCEDVRIAAQEKIEIVKIKLKELTRIKNALIKLAASCHGAGPVGECPLLLEFEKGN